MKKYCKARRRGKIVSHQQSVVSYRVVNRSSSFSVNSSLYCLLAALLLISCAPTPPVNDSGLRAVTAVPTLDVNNPNALCEAASQQWGRDWPTTIRALEALAPLNVTCSDGLAIGNRLYTAYLAYGTLLEQRGKRDEAIQAYQSALEYNRIGVEAADRLRALNVFTPQPPEQCEPNVVMQAVSTMTEYTPTTGSYVRVIDGRLMLNGRPFTVWGVNYFPRDHPGAKFLSNTDVDFIGFELDLIRASGLNTLRIFLRFDQLFMCPGNGAVPIADHFVRLDAFIRAAASREMKLILVLNEAPDLAIYPLYTSPQHLSEQLVYLLTRYRNEPTILAWDLRDGGDLDYLSDVAGQGKFARELVLDWLTKTAILARQTDPNHLITANWHSDTEATIPAVDVVSFQHYGDFDTLRQRIAVLKSETSKPILLSAIGYSTFEGLDETGQRNLLFQAFEAIERNSLAGWVVWTAFDYPLTVTCEGEGCLSEDSALHHFGLWNTSYFPKMAVQAVKEITGTAD